MVREATIQDLTGMAKAVPQGAKPKAYLHWTGGTHDPNWLDEKDYHILITGDGRVFATEDDLTTYKEHTWRRNTEGIGIAVCACLNATIDPGTKLPIGTDYPPTARQIEVMAKVISIVQGERGILITPETTLTHCEIAFIDGYGPGSGDPQTKWDLWKLVDYDGAIREGGDVLRGKANWYKERGL
jgi:hypothetical protein